VSDRAFLALTIIHAFHAKDGSFALAMRRWLDFPAGNATHDELISSIPRWNSEILVDGSGRMAIPFAKQQMI
jgi:hypothetical protein